MKKIGRPMGIVLVCVGILIADLFALAAAYAATMKFPPPLHLIQDHPWWSAGVFTLIGMIIAALLYLQDNSDPNNNETLSDELTNDEVVIKNSFLKRSGISTVTGAFVRIAGSKLKDSPVTVNSDGHDDSAAGGRRDNPK